MSYVTFPFVSDVLSAVSQDIRDQLSATAGPGQNILIDYTNRVHKAMLRFSRWPFVLSEPQYFLTEYGQTSYWLGPMGSAPPGCVDTLLNLPDVDKVRRDSVLDITNLRELKWYNQQPIGPNLINRGGIGRPGLPAVYVQNPNDPNIVQIFPPPNNQNAVQPVPQVPIVQPVTGGALPVRTYLLKVTFIDSLGGESTSTTIGAPLFLASGALAMVKSPATGIFGVLPENATVSGVKYGWYNVYATVATIVNGQPTNEGSETLQNAAPIAFGTDWTEPTSGLITTGRSVPTQNTLQQFGAYIIKFDYYKNRSDLTLTTQKLQIPNDYFDIIVQGVQALAYKLLGKPSEAQESFQLYQAGMREMVMDKNNFPEGKEFIRPDVGTFVNQQILGYLPPNF